MLWIYNCLRSIKCELLTNSIPAFNLLKSLFEIQKNPSNWRAICKEDLLFLRAPNLSHHVLAFLLVSPSVAWFLRRTSFVFLNKLSTRPHQPNFPYLRHSFPLPNALQTCWSRALPINTTLILSSSAADWLSGAPGRQKNINSIGWPCSLVARVLL